MKQKYYAIKVGNNVENLIINNWEECEKLVIGVPAIYKSFDTRKEAKKYLIEMTDEIVETKLLWNEIHRNFRLKEKERIEKEKSYYENNKRVKRK